MKMREIKIITVLLCIVCSISIARGERAIYFNGGSGTTNDPYQIVNANQLALLATVINSGVDYQMTASGETVSYRSIQTASYCLMQDIDLVDYPNWTPIGTNYDRSFDGNFYGNNKTISNLQINASNSSSINYGLFGYISSIQNANFSTINNLTIRVKTYQVASTNAINVGCLTGAGYYNFKILNCHIILDGDMYISSTIEGFNQTTVGGIAGKLGGGGNSFMRNCSITGKHTIKTNTKASNCMIGGLIGMNFVYITNCFVNINEINVTTTNNDTKTGGLVGYLFDSKTLTNSYSIVPTLSTTNGTISELTYFNNMASKTDVGVQNCYAYDIAGTALVNYSDGGTPDPLTNQNFSSTSTLLTEKPLYKLTEYGTKYTLSSSSLQANTSLVNALRMGREISLSTHSDMLDWAIKPGINDGYPIFADETAITLSAGGASNSYTQSTKAGINDALPTLSITTPIANGATFKGYYTQATGGVQLINSTGSLINTNVSGYINNAKWVYNNAELTLYAQWDWSAPSINSTTGYTGTFDNTSHNISVNASHDLGTLTYQWYKNGTDVSNQITDATSNSYAVKNAAESGTYYCKVSTNDGTKTLTTVSNSIQVAISKATPTVTAPSIAAVKFRVPLKLSSITLPTGWSWNSNPTLAIGSNTHTATFTHSDNSNYNTISQNISFTVIRFAGSGNSGSPYLISTPEDLVSLSYQVANGEQFRDMYFSITNDIDMNGYGRDDVAGTGSFYPIGFFGTNGNNNGQWFCAHINGNGHTIYNLHLNMPTKNNVALIGGAVSVSAAKTIQNIAIENSSFIGNWAVGAIAGQNENRITNCYVGANVVVKGQTSVGGICGTSYWTGTMDKCVSFATIDLNAITTGNVGILAGIAETINNSYAAGQFIGTLQDNNVVSSIGGLIGTGRASNCYYDAQLTPYINSCGTASSTNEMINLNKFSWLSTVTAGNYKVPTQFLQSDMQQKWADINSATVYLNTGNSAKYVFKTFSMPNNEEYNWTSNNNSLSLDKNTHTANFSNGLKVPVIVTVTNTTTGLSKEIYLNMNYGIAETPNGAFATLTDAINDNSNEIKLHESTPESMVVNKLIEFTPTKNVVIDNITVLKNGFLHVSGSNSMQVKNVYIESKNEKEPVISGQLYSENDNIKFTASSKLTLNLKLDDTYHGSNTYYAFGVPFAVNVTGGVLNAATKGVMVQTVNRKNGHMRILKYDSQARANGGIPATGSNWVELGREEQMVPGIGYMIATTEATAIELQAATVGFASPNVTIREHTGAASETMHHNWNFISNPCLYFTKLEPTHATPRADLLGYDPQTNTWDLKGSTAISTSNAVMYKGKDAQTVTTAFSTAAEAPALVTANERFTIRFSEANTAYNTIIKVAGDANTSRNLPVFEVNNNQLRMFTGSNEEPMLINHLRVVDGQANTALYLSAPKGGTYTVDAISLADNGELWLTENGEAMHNLSISPYSFTTSNAFNTNDLGLRIVYAPGTTTDTEHPALGEWVAFTKNHELFIQGLVSGDNVTIMDALGRVIYNAISNKSAINMSLPTSGAYIVKVNNQSIKIIL